MKQLKFIRALAVAAVAVLVVSVPVLAQDATPEASAAVLPNIILVHGAWADGSSWAPVIKELQAAGYNVVSPQFPHTSLADNVTRLKNVLATLTGPTILAG